MDYTHCTESGAEFSLSVDRQLMSAVNHATCQAWEKLIILLLDEMYIREDLVYVKSTGKLIGFTVMGDINDHLLAFEKSFDDEQSGEEEVAKTMMAFMVWGCSFG